MAEYDGISQYRKAALRRLRDAEELLQPPSNALEENGAEERHLRAAVYLAGYAVECILKVYIISRVTAATSLSDAIKTRQDRGEQIPNIMGAEGHKLIVLLSLTDLEAHFVDEDRKKDWGQCLKWKSTWRYDPSSPRITDAIEMVHAVRRIYSWVERQI